MTNKILKRLTFDQQKSWFNSNNSSIFLNNLISKGATTYRYPYSSTSGENDKLSFLGEPGENQIEHFNANPSDIAKNIIISRNGPQWEQVGLDIDGEAANDENGISVSMSADGTVLAIGANKGSSPSRGYVRIYKYYTKDGTLTWHQQGQNIDGEAEDNNSGYSVSLSADGSIVAIGANSNDGDNGEVSGHVRVYEFNSSNSSWEQLGEDIDGEAAGDLSGYSVSLSADGSIVAIGAIYNDGDNGEVSGHVRVYEYDATKNEAQPVQTTTGFGPAGWNRLGEDIDGEANINFSGLSVSLSANGSIVAISAPYNDGINGSDSGHVRVYQYDATKTEAQLVNQTAANYGPVGWNRLGGDIDGEAAIDFSGSSVSLSADGSIIAIGAKRNHGINGSDSGHVRVYQYDSTKTEAQLVNQTAANYGPAGWNRLGKDIDGEAAESESGVSVSLSADGTIVAIGANLYGNNRGRVTIYQYDPNKLDWLKVGKGIDGEADEDKFGISVSLSHDGSILAIGAHKNDGINGIDSGHVRVFQIAKRNPWVQQGLDIDGEAVEDFSGYSVSLSADGRTMAISAPNNDGVNGVDSGHVRVYEDINGLWKQKGDDIDGEAFEDFSGWSVSLSADGSVVAIGTVSDDTNGINSGSVRVYEYVNSSWSQRGIDINGEGAGDRSGYSVSLSNDGSVVAIGAYQNDGNGNKSGHVRVYEYVNSSWTQRGVDIDGEAAGYESGLSVSLSDDGLVMAIGAINYDAITGDISENRGHVRVFEYREYTANDEENGESKFHYESRIVDNTQNKPLIITGDSNPSPQIGNSYWIQKGIDIDGEVADDKSGNSVSLNADGSVVAIGAPNNDGNGIDSGHVRVYQYNGSSWVQKGGDIQGEAAMVHSGHSVSLSADGSIVAIGARQNNGGSNFSRVVRIYQFTNNMWIQKGGKIDGEGENDIGELINPYLWGTPGSLSADGSIVAIGAWRNDGANGIDSGHVRVYKFTGWGLGSE